MEEGGEGRDGICIGGESGIGVWQDKCLFIYKNCKWIVKMWRAIYRIDEETGWRSGWREVVE